MGLRADMTSKAPLLILTSSESRTHKAVVSWQPPVMAHTAPTASPLPTCMHEPQLVRSFRADAQVEPAWCAVSQLITAQPVPRWSPSRQLDSAVPQHNQATCTPCGSCLVTAVYPSAYLFLNPDGGLHLGVLPHQPEAPTDDDVQAGCRLVLPAQPAYRFTGLLYPKSVTCGKSKCRPPSCLQTAPGTLNFMLAAHHMQL